MKENGRWFQTTKHWCYAQWGSTLKAKFLISGSDTLINKNLTRITLIYKNATLPFDPQKSSAEKLFDQKQGKKICL